MTPAHSNISTILNELLLGYDSRIRPGYGGPSTIVLTDMNIRSMGPVSEVEMAYSMDCYFRQTWVDNRLQFKGPMETMAVHIKMLDLIWKPDTYFYNGRGSYVHTITTPNKLLRIRQDGKVLYSMRVTIKASCPMYLHYFPVDEQLCPLQFGSYAYTKDDIMYVWKNGAEMSIKTAKDMRLSQFDLIGHPAHNLTVKNRSGGYTSEFSTLNVSFRLRRHMGYFLIQVYVPCTLIVVLSWVSFWINREATADRIGLGITTVLTLTTLSMDTRDDLPKVPYATALDCFVTMCFVFVLGTLLEFAGVHYFTKIGSGEIMHDSDSDEEELLKPEAEVDSTYDYDFDTMTTSDCGGYNNSRCSVRTHVYQKTPFYATVTTNNYNHHTSHTNSSRIYNDGFHPHPPRQQHQRQKPKKSTESCLLKFFRCIQGNSKYRKLLRKKGKITGVNSVSKIDRVSRILFPACFTVLNILYWIAYTRILE